LKKEINKKEQQKKEMADVVEQDKLIEIKGLFGVFQVFPLRLTSSTFRPTSIQAHRCLPSPRA
jgi:nucleosome binding factor SPN SPT16 subunit